VLSFSRKRSIQDQAINIFAAAQQRVLPRIYTACPALAGDEYKIAAAQQRVATEAQKNSKTFDLKNTLRPYIVILCFCASVAINNSRSEFKIRVNL
jgi:hypothetical protein